MEVDKKLRQGWWNDKKDLKKWLAIYDMKQSAWDRETEKQLGAKIRNHKSLSKKDLTTMVYWKFQGLPGRLKQNLARLSDFPDYQIMATFEESIHLSDEIDRIRRLGTLPSVGPAMVSVILTFYDPNLYGVLDIHVWRELFGPEPRGLFQGPKCLLMFLDQIRAIAKRHDMSARDVEKAIFQRNYDEPTRAN